MDVYRKRLNGATKGTGGNNDESELEAWRRAVAEGQTESGLEDWRKSRRD